MKWHSAFILSFVLFSGFTESCSQSASPTQRNFTATTPCQESVRRMLGIPDGTIGDMLRWDVTLNQKSNDGISESFRLVCEYGMPKQGTKGFEAGSHKIELSGKCLMSTGIPGDATAVVYTLRADSSQISLSFFQPDQNLLHLLNDDKTLVNGTGAWSYTFNRTEPAAESTGNFKPLPASEVLTAVAADTIGVFDGRTPCNDQLRRLKNIPATRCDIVKCRLILLRDRVTGTPGQFILYTIYVGNGDDNRYSTTGKWKVMKGTLGNPAAIVYSLEPDGSSDPVLLVKGDDNILFFIDSGTHFMVGNTYASYTLNRKKK